MRPEITQPRQTTIANWIHKYPEFGGIFDETPVAYMPIYVDPLVYDTQELVFGYLVQKQSSRIVTPPMTYDTEKDLRTIEKIAQIIYRQAIVIKPKYDLLKQTIPDDIAEYFENYSMSRQKTRNKKVKEGTISNSGNDITYNNTHSTTTNTTSTGESESPRFEKASTTSTGSDNNTADNSVQTTYGRVTTSRPGDEDVSERTTAHGYYNSGTKATMIKDVREIIQFNILDEWIREILPCFCCAYYNPAWSYPTEFIL